jgi:septal ring factor EnvC (AmiA/AmiB activator)
VDTTNTASVSVLTDKVNAFKIIARNALRMELISPRLTKIAGLEADLEDNAKTVKETNHDITVENYEIGVLDQNHPDYEKTKADKEATVKEDQAELVELATEATEINKEIAEQKAAIQKIESGETKVSLDRLNETVEKLVTSYAREEAKLVD